MKTTTPQSSAFTLIELLIVIAIISLLSALLLPATARSLQRGQQTYCASNLRQLTIANQQHATTEQHYVPAAPDIHTTNKQRWHGTRTTANQPFTPDNGPLTPYLRKNKKIRKCPTLKNTSNQGFEAGCGGYGYNSIGIGSQTYIKGSLQGALQGIDPAQITSPNQTLMFTDTAFNQRTRKGNTLIEYSFAEPYYHLADNTPTQTYITTPSIHFRHNNRANIAWTDGHIDTQHKKQHTSQNTTWKKNIGWLTPGSNKHFKPF